MTQTTQQEYIRGAMGGVVIALAVVIAIFAFYALAQAQTMHGTINIQNGADSVIGLS